MPFDFKHQLENKNDIFLTKNKLFCVTCNHWITSGDWKMNIKSGHEHTVFNPAGVVFSIGCFRDAPGCSSTGQPSSNFTWFPGYKWRLAFCEGCGKHVGWLFTGQIIPAIFFGLILNRLTDTIQME